MAYKPSAWDLSDLAPQKGRLWGGEQLKFLLEKAKKIESLKSTFVPSISNSDFISLVHQLEDLAKLEGSLSEFAYLWFSENTKNSDALAFKSAVERAGTEVSNMLLFFNVGFPRFPKKEIDRLISSASSYKYMLTQLAKKKDHLLPEEHERLINLKDVHGIDKVQTIYNILTASFTFDFEGKKVTQSELSNLVHSPKSDVRKKAYQTLLSKFHEQEAVLGEIYQGIVLDWRTENVDLRKYASPLSVRNEANDIPDTVIETLLSVVEKNQHVFWRYFALKAKMLKTKKLSRFDLYAPIKKPTKKISYTEGVRIVLDTFSKLSPLFYEFSVKLLEQKHIHSLISEGKYQGGYCYGSTPSVNPYILLNYTEDPNSVSTLAHELGHAIHFMLAAKKHNVFHVHSALPIAETASIFAETVLIDRLQQKYPALAIGLAFEQLDHLYASIGRQIEFVLFEIAAHKAAHEGASTEEIKKMYLERLRKHFGPNVDVPEDFANEWNYIPHIHNTPFYCYAYGFGNLLSLAVYSSYQKQGKPFLDKMIIMLSEGGSMSPMDLVKIVGFDIADPHFWQSGFDIITKILDDLERRI